MKVTQATAPYKPILIHLETRSDAMALFGIIDKVERYRCNEGAKMDLSRNEIAMVVRLSNIQTNMDVDF